MLREEKVSSQEGDHLPSYLMKYMDSCGYKAYITNESAKSQGTGSLQCPF